MIKQDNKLMTHFRKFYYFFALLATFLIIYILYPKQGNFKYEFQKGRPWNHETLIAPFDFPILKSQDIVDVEKDSLFKTFVPYFIYDHNVESSQLAVLKSDLKTALGDRRSIYLKIEPILTSIYSDIYSKGILEHAISSYPVVAGKDVVNFIDGNVSTRVSLSDIYSLKTAYLTISEKLRLLSESDANLALLQQKLDFSKYILPNLSFDESLNEMRINELLSGYSTTRGVVPADVRIISQGDMVTTDNYQILESLRKAYQMNRSYGGWISYFSFGQMILVASLLIILVIYLQSFNPQLFWQKRNFSLILTTIVLMFGMARLIVDSEHIDLYLLPVCILPIIIRTFLGARNAIFIHVISVLLIAFMAPNSFEYVFIQIIAGALAVISLNKLYQRGHLVITAILLIGAYSIMYFGFELIKEGSFNTINWNNFKWFAGSSLLLLIAYPLIYVFEKIFKLVSDVTLMELSDTNNPLLRQMAETAPGTFQHSMQVANLAEEVIRQTGGNAMLVRTGALYHDVGKIVNSQYFIENQLSGINPHDELTFIQSAEKIINHVHDGVVLARKHKIPEVIIDFIKMHHGRSQTRFFFLKYKEAHPDEKIEMEHFLYPGPIPFSRETAVVMLADGVEAASRSLPVKNEETLRNIINQIIDSRVQTHELDNAAITFKDIKDIKSIFLEKLKTVYHLRIQYPIEKQ